MILHLRVFLVFCMQECMCIGIRPEFRHREMSHCCTRWEQHLFELMFRCQVHRTMLQLQGVPVESELHVKLHVADENLQQPDMGGKWEERGYLLSVWDISLVSNRQVSGSYLLEKPSFTLSSSTLWTYPVYTVIGWSVSPDSDTLRQSPRSTDGRFSATPGTCRSISMLAFSLLCI